MRTVLLTGSSVSPALLSPSLQEIPAEDMLQYIAEKRREGAHITVTHIAIKAVAKVLKMVPSVNGRLVLGRYYPAKTADVGCLVAIKTAHGALFLIFGYFARLITVGRRGFVGFCVLNRTTCWCWVSRL